MNPGESALLDLKPDLLILVMALMLAEGDEKG